MAREFFYEENFQIVVFGGGNRGFFIAVIITTSIAGAYGEFGASWYVIVISIIAPCLAIAIILSIILFSKNHDKDRPTPDYYAW